MSDLTGTNFDSELDSFLNYDQEETKPTPSMLHHSTSFTSNLQQPQAYPQPSYEYEQFKQTTGLPVGGLANTFAHNQATGLHYRQGNQSVMPTQTLNMPLSNFDEFDFGRAQLDNGNDMDFDAESPTFYAGSSTISPTQQAPQRIYPGMHTQKAAQAKIQQAQRQEIMRQQQHQQKHLAGQLPLPVGTPKTTPNTSKDPHVEESISRILSRMRQSSDASVEDDEDSPSGSQHLTKFKKDEEDMDEDERLLNSEEGKKLTSKERRQLRNKVSARAFRSRRKEYIGQLEAEVAQKAQEANDLRVQNRQLMEENTRLTDLTRMLLSSNSFAGFLQELSQSGNAPLNIPQAQPRQMQQQQQQPQQQTTQKDISTHQASQQVQSSNQQMTVGMTLVPETHFDMSMFGGSSAWNTVVPSSTDFQVFAVTELPEPPKLDLSILSGKRESTQRPFKDVPVVPELPTAVPSEPVVEQIDETVELDTEKHALFFASIAPSPDMATLLLPTDLALQIAKNELSSEIRSATKSCAEEDSWQNLERFCTDLEKDIERLSRYMS